MGGSFCPSPADRAAAPPAPEIHDRASPPPPPLRDRRGAGSPGAAHRVRRDRGGHHRWQQGCRDPDRLDDVEEHQGRPRPRLPGPAHRHLHPDDLRPVPGIGRCARPGALPWPAHDGRLPDRVPAQGGQRRHPGRPTRRARPALLRPGLPQARRRHPGRPGDLAADLDAVHPEREPAGPRRPLAALRGARAQREPARPVDPGAARCWARACPRTCASARPRSEPTSPAPGRTPSASRPSSARSVRPTRTQSTFTPTARDRCQQLVGSYGGFWQPPSRAGWAPATGSSGAWSARAEPGSELHRAGNPDRLASQRSPRDDDEWAEHDSRRPRAPSNGSGTSSPTSTAGRNGPLGEPRAPAR